MRNILIKKSSKDFESLLEDLDMEEYFEENGVDYKVTQGSSGRQLNVRVCPRCGGSSWKVYLNSETGLGNCFHGYCVGEPGFNKFTFIKHFIDGDNKETSREINKFLGNNTWRPKRQKRKIDSSYIFENKYPQTVPIVEGTEAFNYLLKRGFDSKTISYYGWEYCDSGFVRFTNPQGVVEERDFSKRIIIPVNDINGNFQTFQGRDITGTASKKYLFPPGLKGSGTFLYDSENALGAKEVILGEGIMDVASIRQIFRGEIATIGSFGISISSVGAGQDQFSQLYTLKSRGLKSIVFMWDGEYNAAMSAIKYAWQLVERGFVCYVAFLPFGKDPNEAGSLAVKDAYKNAVQIDERSKNKLLLQLKSGQIYEKK